MPLDISKHHSCPCPNGLPPTGPSKLSSNVGLNHIQLLSSKVKNTKHQWFNMVKLNIISFWKPSLMMSCGTQWHFTKGLTTMCCNRWILVLSAYHAAQPLLSLSKLPSLKWLNLSNSWHGVWYIKVLSLCLLNKQQDVEHTFPDDSRLLFLGTDMSLRYIEPLTLLALLQMTHLCPSLWMCASGVCIISSACPPPVILHDPPKPRQALQSALLR